MRTPSSFARSLINRHVFWILISCEPSRCPGKSKREIRIRVEANENSVFISYWDNGPGIDKSVEQISEILNFNYSTKYDDKGNPTGTGLGLWMLESAVRSNGGVIKLYRPTDEHGFRMDLELPNRQEIE